MNMLKRSWLGELAGRNVQFDIQWLNKRQSKYLRQAALGRHTNTQTSAPIRTYAHTRTLTRPTLMRMEKKETFNFFFYHNVFHSVADDIFVLLVSRPDSKRNEVLS